MGAHSRAELDFERVLSLLKVRPRLLPTPRMKRQQASDLSDADFFLGEPQAPSRSDLANIVLAWTDRPRRNQNCNQEDLALAHVSTANSSVNCPADDTPIDRRLKRLAQYSFGVKYDSQRSKFAQISIVLLCTPHGFLHGALFRRRKKPSADGRNYYYSN